MTYDYRMQGTCARSVSFDIDENGLLHNIEFVGGCNGNLKAISKLCEGKSAAEVADILEGNTCGYKNTSCADQLSKGIKKALENG